MASTVSKRRKICTNCNRPEAKACICSALPDVKVQLRYTYCIILQHPNESKQHQNRTLPFIEHCIDSKCYLKLIGRRFPSLLSDGDVAAEDSHASEHAVSSLRSSCTSTKRQKPIYTVNHESYVQCMNSLVTKPLTEVWLLSSHDDQDNSSMTLTKALQEWEDRRKSLTTFNDANMSAITYYPYVIVIALDATWKYASEMDRANIRHQCYPMNTGCMRRIRLTASDFQHPLFQQQEQNRQAIDERSRTQDSVATIPHRFAIRSPPKATKNTSTDNEAIVFLSTAECLAYVLSRIEQNDTIYHTIMKPLDLMVQQWKSHYVVPTPTT
jgi:DTW domain-containing protein YfiP